MKYLNAVVLALTILIPLGAAQQQGVSIPDTVETEGIVELVGLAEEDILVASRSFQNMALIEALRRAINERGVRVFILTTERATEVGGSGVDHLAATNVVNHDEQTLTKLANVDADVMVIDYSVLVAGDLIGSEVDSGEYGTTVTRDANRINFVVNRFSGVYQDAPIYIPEVGAR